MHFPRLHEKNPSISRNCKYMAGHMNTCDVQTKTSTLSSDDSEKSIVCPEVFTTWRPIWCWRIFISQAIHALGLEIRPYRIKSLRFPCSIFQLGVPKNVHCTMIVLGISVAYGCFFGVIVIVEPWNVDWNRGISCEHRPVDAVSVTVLRGVDWSGCRAYVIAHLRPGRDKNVIQLGEMGRWVNHLWIYYIYTNYC